MNSAEQSMELSFTRKDYEFMQELVGDGEYVDVAAIVRDAVKRFRLEWNCVERVEK